MNPNIWGPHAWFFLYSTALAYPENPTDSDKKNYNNFYMSIMNVLPCLKCRMHYSENIKKHPLTEDILNSKKLLFKWLHLLHNEVRDSQNKKRYELNETYEFFNKAYSNNKFPIKEVLNMKILLPVIIIIICILGLVIYNKKFNQKINLIN
jgi:hypothetical protein